MKKTGRRDGKILGTRKLWYRNRPCSLGILLAHMSSIGEVLEYFSAVIIPLDGTSGFNVLNVFVIPKYLEDDMERLK